MKKTILAITVMAVMVAAFGVVGFVYAQTVVPPQPQDNPNFGRGMMGSGRGHGPGMMGFQRDEVSGYGPMHEFMLPALAEKLEMTVEELQAALDEGKTVYQVAQEKGLTDEQIRTLMVDARTEALEQAVAAGVITQEQADWMNQRMQRMQQGGFGPGSCHGQGPQRGMMRGFRSNNS